MSALCVICSTEKRPVRAIDGTMVCFNDSNRILRWLRELEEYLPTLSLLRSPAGGEPVSGPGFGSKSPADDMVIVHTDPRSGTEVTTHEDGTVSEELSALGVVTSWTELTAEERGVKAPKTAFGCMAFLRGNHDWIARQLWVDEYAKELRRVHAAVRALAHEPVARKLGKCIRFEGGSECLADVYELEDASGARCSRDKRHTYTGLDLVRFRVAQDGETA